MNSEFENELIIALLPYIKSENMQAVKMQIQMVTHNYEIRKAEMELAIYEGDINENMIKRFAMAKMAAEGSDDEGADDSIIQDEPLAFVKECKVTVIESDSDDEQNDGSSDDDEIAPDNKNADGSGPDKGGSPSPDKKKGAVKTGDDSKLMLWSALFLAALAESVLILIRRKRSGN